MSIQNKYKLERYESIKALPQKYDDIFSQYPAEDIFLSRSWFKLFEDSVVGQEGRVRLYGLVHLNELETAALLLPLWERSSLGGYVKTLSSLGNYYTGNYEPLYARNEVDLQDVLLALLEIIGKQGDWHTIDFRSLIFERPEFKATESAFMLSGLLYQRYFMCGNWYLSISNQSYEDTARARPGVLRSTIKRKRKKFSQIAGASIQVLLGKQIGWDNIKDYWSVYDSSWKSQESHRQFIENILINSDENITPVLGLAYLGNEAVAAQIWLVGGEKAFIYKLAHRDEYRGMSIGTILLDRIMGHLCDVYSVKEVDFLTGDDEYKRQWMSDRREIWGMLVFNSHTLVGTLLGWGNIYGQRLKRMLVGFLLKKVTHE